MLDLKLTATAQHWRLWMARKKDPAFQTFQQRVLERDQYTCQYCEFRAMSHQEIVNQDGNFQNNKISNLVTACPLCAQCFFLESLDMGNQSGGQLIYLPEMTQNQLNALCHV